MKKNYLILLLFITSMAMHAYDVSTEVTPKKVLIEDYTGIYCTYCPYAHATLSTVGKAHPDEAYMVGIHAGSYAAATGDDPDFCTDEGTSLSSYYGISTYPSGMVNRHIFSGSSLITYYYDWIKDSKEILATDAPLNLSMNTTYDGDTGTLSVTIEGYYTAQGQESLQCLNVLWTQGNIVGLQSGSSQGTEYVHDHVLRGYISPLWGDTLDTPQCGDYFTKTYTYTLPEIVGNIAVVPEDIEVIAFVAAGKSEVLQVVGAKPTYINHDVPLAATISEPLIPVSTRYGFNFFEVAFTSYTTDVITAASFELTINTEVQTYEWSGELAPFATTYIELPIEEYTSKSINNIEIALVALNSQSIESSSTVSAVFSSPYATTPTVKIYIKTDAYADENRYVIKDVNGDIVEELGAYTAGVSAEYQEVAMLDADAVYCIEIQDSEGDGVQSPASGYVQIYNDDDTYITQNYSINDFGGRLFFTTTTTSGTIEPVQESLYTYDTASGTIALCNTAIPAQFAILSISGDALLQTTEPTLSVATLPQGIYLLRLVQGGKQTIEKIVIQ